MAEWLDGWAAPAESPCFTRSPKWSAAPARTKPKQAGGPPKPSLPAARLAARHRCRWAPHDGAVAPVSLAQARYEPRRAAASVPPPTQPRAACGGRRCVPAPGSCRDLDKVHGRLRHVVVLRPRRTAAPRRAVKHRHDGLAAPPVTADSPLSSRRPPPSARLCRPSRLLSHPHPHNLSTLCRNNVDIAPHSPLLPHTVVINATARIPPL